MVIKTREGEDMTVCTCRTWHACREERENGEVDKKGRGLIRREGVELINEDGSCAVQ